MHLSKITSDVSNFISSTRTTIVNASTWGVHKVQWLTTQYLIPLSQKIWAGALAVMRAAQAIIKANPALPFVLASAFFFGGIVAFKLADHKAYEENKLVQTAWKSLGIAAFVMATLSTSVGLIYRT